MPVVTGIDCEVCGPTGHLYVCGKCGGHVNWGFHSCAEVRLAVAKAEIEAARTKQGEG